MFIDDITLTLKAGNGGDGVVGWRREKFVDRGGPWGGNGGRGGDVYIEATRDLTVLTRYSGEKSYAGENGEAGKNGSKDGQNGGDFTLFVPVGSKVTDTTRGRVYEFGEVGARERVLKGGGGGKGNEHFKSSTNRSPDTRTRGGKGEEGVFHIEVGLVVSVGIIGLPNAGKSTLLNALTNAHSRVGAYPFTTLEPHLGDYHGHTIADIPGLIEGAAQGKGLGHRFLRHVTKTKLLLHAVSLQDEDPKASYEIVRRELVLYGKELGERDEIIVLTKADLVSESVRKGAVAAFKEAGKTPFVVSAETSEGLEDLQKTLSTLL